MTGYTTKNGFFIVPFGRNVLDFLNNNEISIIWDEETLKDHINRSSFHCDENTPPQIIPITVNIPFEIPDAVEAPRDPQPRGFRRVPANDRERAADILRNVNAAVFAAMPIQANPLQINDDIEDNNEARF